MRGNPMPLGIGKRKVSHCDVSIERAVYGAVSYLHAVVEFIFLDLGDHETAPRVAVEAYQEKRYGCDEPEQRDADPAREAARPGIRGAHRLAIGVEGRVPRHQKACPIDT